MMGRSEMWPLEGYVDGLHLAHRVILIDARGHGHSARPTDPADYGLHCHVADVLAVLDELGVESAALCGWSMGAATALRAAACAPERVGAVAALGAPLEWVGFPDVPPPDEDEDDEDGWASRFEREGMGWVASDLEREGRPTWARLIERADPIAMAACDRGWGRLKSVPCRLGDLAGPLLFAWGEREAHPENTPLLPAAARVIVVPDEDHVGVFRRADILLPALLALLATQRPAPVAAGW